MNALSRALANSETRTTPRIPGIVALWRYHRHCYYTMGHSISLFLVSAKVRTRARAIPITPRCNKVQRDAGRSLACIALGDS